MRTKIIIEHEKIRPTWRIVARACTSDGLSNWCYTVLKPDLPNLQEARDEFRWIKHVKPEVR